MPNPKQPALKPHTPKPEHDEGHPAEREQAADWGERIATGKTIGRGGQSSGPVPGATEQKS